MSFTVEDGTNVSGANAYVTRAFADTHHGDQGRTDWSAASTDDRQKAIVRATFYIDKRFGRKFRGEKIYSDQSLEWPRVNAWDNDGHEFTDVPTQLQKACAEYALIALRQGELEPQPLMSVPAMSLAGVQGSASATGEIAKEKVGPIETEYRAPDIAESRVAAKSSVVTDGNIPEYPAADLWMEELLKSATSRTLVRA